MITLRRAEERHHTRASKHDIWHTFHPEDRADMFADGFGALQTLNERRLGAGAYIPLHLKREAEVITYVRLGTLADHDSLGRSGIIATGEFQRLSAGRGVRVSETNASRTDLAHVFEIHLRPSEAELDPCYEQKRFSAADRRGGLCVVASNDGRRGSLHLHQDARVYSSLLISGQHVFYELPIGRSAWLHVVQGEVTLDDIRLTPGDGAGIVGERGVSVTASVDCSILLLDVVAVDASLRVNGAAR
jgi:redox-sensitive bicupin YhaK (pirin superfamily)